LLQALSIIYESHARQSQNQHHPEIAAAPIERPRELEFNEVRIARVEEWNKFPLNTQEQQQNWMHNRVATTRTATRVSSEAHQEDAADLTRNPHAQQRYHESGTTKKRRKTASGRRDTLSLEEDHGAEFTTSTASPSARPPVSGADGGWTANILDGNPLESPLGTVVSDLQHTNTQSSALHSTAATSHNNISNTPGVEQETQREQYTSKAKRLVTLHFRKYF
jgi:hypothetical protein